jgi:hypothetical protein
MAERIVIEGDEARLSNGKAGEVTAKLDDWLACVIQYGVRGMSSEPIPDNVKWLVEAGSVQIVIVELKPELRRMLWLDERQTLELFGPEALARQRRLATPYVILKVPMLRGRVVPRVEVFYRTSPLTSLSGEGGQLLWPNLLNVSPHAYECTSWFCTQYLHAQEVRPGLTAGLHAVVNHLFGGAFNRSSEAHEGASTFSKAVDEGVDPRISDVDRWEEESVKDPRFVLSVPWRPVGLTVGELIDNELKRARIRRNKFRLSTLANHLLRAAKTRKGPK